MFSAEEVAAAAGKSIDWRNKGAVTDVKDQAECPCCWSFSAAGSIEGQWAISGNKLVSLSSQELVSCDNYDGGCGGGLMENAFEWLLKYRKGELSTEESYPFVSGSLECHMNASGFGPAPKCDMRNRTVGARITSYKDIPRNEDQMAAFVLLNGPLAIGVDSTSFQHYTGGIVTKCTGNELDHAVLIVGVDDAHKPPYWIVKNQWGKGWGEQGYIRIKKGTNQCLIREAPITAIVAGGPNPTQAAH
jgi:cysteine peptidase B